MERDCDLGDNNAAMTPVLKFQLVTPSVKRGLLLLNWRARSDKSSHLSNECGGNDKKR